MRITTKICLLLCASLALGACVSKKKYLSLQTALDAANRDLGTCGEKLSDLSNRLSACEQERFKLQADLGGSQTALKVREDQIKDLKAQVTDVQTQRDRQLTQVNDLTTLSKSANENIRETLSQLEKKDKYIHLLQLARTRADSINLALAVNLKSVLREGIDDQDVEVKVDKTVVFVNLSDRMLYQSGSSSLTPRAHEVLGKIARIVESRPDLEVMVEGYTDNVPIQNACVDDNWDLSVKRATSVVRVLQKNYGINPNRLIAAGRGEYNTLATNNTEAGRATNRRTRIIILPKLDQFYDLLNPNKTPEK
ncbi:MAG: OmpA family protein [Saprospiraceae bacterium]